MGAMEIRLYPEMNEKIVDILRVSDNPADLYAAALIESLQAQLAESQRRADKAVEDIMCADHCDVCLHKGSGTSCEMVDFECGQCADPQCLCRCCRNEDKWQWRGVDGKGD